MQMMLPIREGQRCEQCPRFSAGMPVEDRRPTKEWSGLLLLGEAPGDEEVRQNTAFVGPTGRLLDLSLKQVGVDPETVWFKNAIICGLPWGRKLTEKEERLAVACCFPLIIGQLERIRPTVVTCLGTSAWESLTGLRKIEAYRGCVLAPPDAPPAEGEGERDWFIVPTLHPAGLLRREEKRPAFDMFCADLAKSAGLCSGVIRVDEPEPMEASYVNVLRFLRQIRFNPLERPVALDIETDSIHPETANIVSLGFSSGGECVCVVLPTFGGAYSRKQWKKLYREIQDMFSERRVSWIFHNKQFDVPRLEKHFKTAIRGTRHDTMLQHHAIWPKTMHDLQNVATQLFAVRPWKEEFDVTKADLRSSEVMGQLAWYNACDAWATEKAFNRMTNMLPPNNVVDVYETDRVLGDITIDWTRVGVLVDEEKRASLEVSYAAELGQLLEELRDDTGSDKFNPLSSVQLTRQLANRGLLPTKRTKTGKLSTDAKALFAFREDPFVSKIMHYRKIQKLYSTYIEGLGAKVWTDGRLHPRWNITTTPTGRFGTTPAIQNWPNSMREMLIAPPGFVWIGADYKALELRIIAQLSGAEDLIQMFLAEKDVHLVNASEVYFAKLWPEATPEERGKLRKLGKSVTFGDNYMAGAQTLYETVRKLHPYVTLEEVTIMQAMLRNRYPNKVKFAQVMQREANKNFELRTPWLGRRRRWPLGQVPDTEASNHPIQGGAGDIAGEAAIRWIELLQAKGDYHTRVFPNIQIHDAYYAYAREDYAEQALQDLLECMYCEKDAMSPVTKKPYHMVYSVEGQMGHDLKNMKEVSP